jgi:hypothetical protein
VLQYYGVGRTKFIIEAQQEDGRHDGQDDIQMAANKESDVVLYKAWWATKLTVRSTSTVLTRTEAKNEPHQ